MSPEDEMFCKHVRGLIDSLIALRNPNIMVSIPEANRQEILSITSHMRTEAAVLLRTTPSRLLEGDTNCQLLLEALTGEPNTSPTDGSDAKEDGNSATVGPSSDISQTPPPPYTQAVSGAVQASRQTVPLSPARLASHTWDYEQDGHGFIQAMERFAQDSSFDGVFQVRGLPLDTLHDIQSTTRPRGPGSRTPRLQVVEWSKNIGVPGIRRCYVKQGVRRTLPDFCATATTTDAAHVSRPSHEEAKEFLQGIADGDGSTEVPYYVGEPFSEALDGIVRCGATVQEAFGSTNVPGITEPYWYVGSHLSGSCMHTEDGGLRSVNVVFSGFKIWIVVPAGQRAKLEAALDSSLDSTASSGSAGRAGWRGADGEKCRQYIRHESIVVSPEWLEGNGIIYHLHRCGPGEAVATRPGEYHWVANYGACFALSVNFALPGDTIDLSRESMCPDDGLYPLIDTLGEHRPLASPTSGSDDRSSAATSTEAPPPRHTRSRHPNSQGKEKVPSHGSCGGPSSRSKLPGLTGKRRPLPQAPAETRLSVRTRNGGIRSKIDNKDDGGSATPAPFDAKQYLSHTMSTIEEWNCTGLNKIKLDPGHELSMENVDLLKVVCAFRHKANFEAVVEALAAHREDPNTKPNRLEVFDISNNRVSFLAKTSRTVIEVRALIALAERLLCCRISSVVAHWKKRSASKQIPVDCSRTFAQEGIELRKLNEYCLYASIYEKLSFNHSGLIYMFPLPHKVTGITERTFTKHIAPAEVAGIFPELVRKLDFTTLCAIGKAIDKHLRDAAEDIHILVVGGNEISLQGMDKEETKEETKQKLVDFLYGLQGVDCGCSL